MQQNTGGWLTGLPRGRMDAWMTETRGRTSGFDYLRIILATLVVLSHSRLATLGPEALSHAGAAAFGAPPLRQPILWAIVPSFFALSGFLVAGSLMRAKTIFEFAMLRVLRIIPALFVETVIAAFILGPLVTDLPWHSYFTDAKFWSYPLNIVGDVHFVLPGVFTQNPDPHMVNAQLWTIPGEFLCYLTLVLAYLMVLVASRLGLFQLRTGLGLLTVGTLVVLLASMAHSPGTPVTWRAGGDRVELDTLVLSFLVGVSVFFYQDRIPLRLDLFLVSLPATFILLYDGTWQYLAAIPLTYATVYIGLSNFPKTLITATGDYSYGVYLYGYPIQQTLAYLFPHNKIWQLNFLGSMVVSMMFAAFSWHFIESRVLANRKAIIQATHAAVMAIIPRRRPTPALSAKPADPL